AQIMAVSDNTFGAGQFGVGSFNDSGYFDDVKITAQGCTSPLISKVDIPVGIKVPAGSTIAVPIIVSTTEDIGLAQFTVEYNGNVLQFSNATIGPDAPGFSVSQVQTNPPFPPTTPGTDRNVVVQISGGGGNIFTGNRKTVVYLNFQAVGSIGDTTVLAFDDDCARTCLTTSSLQDICGSQLTMDNGSAIINISPDVLGHVRYYDANRPVSDAGVTLSGAIQQTQTTDAAGLFQFANVPPGNYTLRSSKTNDVRNAITGADALALLRAIGFIINLTPEQQIAGDVDRNGSITPSDPVAILRYLAFLTTGTASTGEWIFDPEVASIQVSTDVTQDVTAYLLGDVTGDWGSSAAIAAKGQFPRVKLEEAFLEGDSLRIPLQVTKEATGVFTIVTSLQWQIAGEIAPNFIPAKQGVFFALNNTDPAKTHLALACLDGFQAGEKIGELVVRLAEQESENLQHIATVTSLQVNDRALEEREILLAKPAANIPEQFELYQNYPNPFNINTTIRYGVPKLELQQEIVLEIYSLNGQLVRRLYQGEAEPGFHTANWDGRDETGKIAGTGLYIYRLRSGSFAKSAKLLLVK
ncbi:MAG: T9SS type A sorting domain-containing protein, partial [bacterium]